MEIIMCIVSTFKRDDGEPLTMFLFQLIMRDT